jgi:hypothetical protein
VTTLRKAARLAHPAAAALVLALVFAQLYFIAEWAFSQDASALLDHKHLGPVVALVEGVVFLTGLVGWWSDRREVVLSSVMIVVGFFQVMFATNRFGAATDIRGLHGLLAVGVVICNWQILARTWRVLVPASSR